MMNTDHSESRAAAPVESQWDEPDNAGLVAVKAHISKHSMKHQFHTIKQLSNYLKLNFKTEFQN